MMAETCGKCHRKSMKSGSVRAMRALLRRSKPKGALFDAACVGCHSVGFQKGFVNIKVTPQFANVQCKLVMAPAPNVKMPRMTTIAGPPPAGCVVCHDRDNSPDFVFQKYWPLVAHTNSLKVPQPKPGRTPVEAAALKNGTSDGEPAQILPTMIRLAGDHEEVREQAAFTWRIITGEGLANTCRPFRLYRRHLVIATLDTTWKRQMEAMSGEILFRLNSLLGSPMVTHRFRIDREHVVAGRHQDEPTYSFEHIQELKTELQPAAEKIKDEELRAAFLRAASVSWERVLTRRNKTEQTENRPYADHTSRSRKDRRTGEPRIDAR